MNRAHRGTVALLLIELLGACSGPMDSKIDASTAAAYDRSLKNIEAKLTPEEARRLQQAIAVLTVTQLFGESNNMFETLAKLARDGGSPGAAQAQVLASIDGKTPRELIAAAHAKLLQCGQAELKRVSDDVTRLERKRSRYETDRRALAQIAITQAQYYWGKASLAGSSEQPTLEFAVANGTARPLARIYCHGVVSSPGRPIPWIEEDFDSAIPGGLEPGEFRRLRVTPNMLWGPPETKGRNDLVLTVTVINAEGPDGKKLAEPFDTDDAQTLDEEKRVKTELEQKLAALSAKE